MLDPLDMLSIPGYEQIEDEAFPPLPPPHSPGWIHQEEEDGELSKLAEVPAAKPSRVKRPQPKLDSQRLISERGLPALRTLFDNVHFKGKGHEAEDLRLLMHKMENWAHRLYPKLQFEDFIQKVEKLGTKKEVQTCLKRIRLDMPLTHDDFISKDGEEDAGPAQHILEEPDPFASEGFPDDRGPIHSTPAPTHAPPTLTEEQRRRIELNKQLALERRLARKQQQHADLADSQNTSTAGYSSQASPQRDHQDLNSDPAQSSSSSSSSSSTELHHKAPPEDSPPPPNSPDGVNPEVSPSATQTANGIQDDD